MLQRYPLAPLEVRITLPPGQKVSGPLAEIVGMDEGEMVTMAGTEVPPQVPEVVTL